MSQDPKVQFFASPYTDIFVQVQLRGSSTTQIHKGVVPAKVLLSRRMKVPAPGSATPILDMQDLACDTAHAVIDFFYTRQYDCIKPRDVTRNSSKGYELKVSLQVIEAARMLELPALVYLAQRECARLCQELDLLNLVAILGKLDFDYTNFPEIKHHIAYHLENVLASPHSQFTTDLLSRATTNSITDMLVRKLVMTAREGHKSETKAKPLPKNGFPGVIFREPRPQPPFEADVIAKPEMPKTSQELQTKQFQLLLKKMQPDDKGKGRDDSEQAKYSLKVPLPTTPQQDSCLAKGQEDADSGPSRLREGPNSFLNPSSGVETVPSARKESNAPQRGGSSSKLAQVLSSHNTSWNNMIDDRMKVIEANMGAKMEAKRSEPTLIETERKGATINPKPHPTTTPGPSNPTELGNSIANSVAKNVITKMKDFIVVETNSAIDWELPKSVAERCETPESERQDSTPVDSDSDGVLVQSEPQPTVTSSSTGSGSSTNPMGLFLAFDRRY
ncbi:hypothetical protein FGADI_10971 [Fusarium gaditjirri]|uniref:BTB domain-containing protein n=1 Tax=Fusarium gaditjirri TaxID=282569 RepID=A0A8H4SWF3_9HYPO|nr:hypothetical protein FGADI_10971 [Fusarium gaditjirri]